MFDKMFETKSKYKWNFALTLHETSPDKMLPVVFNVFSLIFW